MKLCPRMGSILTTVPSVIENKMWFLIWGYFIFHVMLVNDVIQIFHILKRKFYCLIYQLLKEVCSLTVNFSIMALCILRLCYKVYTDYIWWFNFLSSDSNLLYAWKLFCIKDYLTGVASIYRLSIYWRFYPSFINLLLYWWILA